MKLYIAYSRDKYHLPVAVADSAGELARMIGKSKNTVLSAISHGITAYAKVEVED